MNIQYTSASEYDSRYSNSDILKPSINVSIDNKNNKISVANFNVLCQILAIKNYLHVR